MLHKKRTGKSLHVTKDVVEKEAMYEEIDERYQEKRILMLQAQNMQIGEQLNRKLLVALAVRTSRGSSSSSSSSSPAASLSSAATRSSFPSSASSAASHHHQPRRATSITRRVSVNDVCKVCLDLSCLCPSVSEGMQTGQLTSPMIMHQDYVMSPGYGTLSPSSQNQLPEWYSPQLPSYVQQAPRLQQWTGFQPQPGQQHIAQDILQESTHFPVRQFRNRFSSAPEISLHDLPANSLSIVPPTPAAASPPAQRPPQHSRVRSEPDLSMVMQHLQQPDSQSPSPKVQPTLDACPSTITPQSPKSTGLEPVPVPVPQPDLEAVGKDSERMLSSHDSLGPDFDDFSRFALGLGNGAEPVCV